MSRARTDRFQLSLKAVLGAIVVIALVLGTVGPVELAIIAAAAVIGATVGGISAGTQVATMQIAARQFARDRSQGDPDPIGHTQTIAILLDRLFSWSVRRFVEIRGWSVPLVAASMASGSLFVSVAWWMVGLELTLIIDRWWVLFLLTLLLGFLISAIALVARMLFRRPTVHKFLLVGSQVAIQCTDSIRMPVGEWLKRWSARGGLMIPLPPWLRLMIGWAVATTAFFLLFVVFSALGYELLYHPPQVFSPALWFMNLLRARHR